AQRLFMSCLCLFNVRYLDIGTDIHNTEIEKRTKTEQRMAHRCYESNQLELGELIGKGRWGRVHRGRCMGLCGDPAVSQLR
uniref:Protein kinase domain-containing protein n=1 Tax=Electrophorus electricus TaxID=8005 RepID=A0AAY5F2B4_ELEEL